MKLNEVVDAEVPLVVSMTRKLLASGKEVMFDRMNYRHDVTSWDTGPIISIDENWVPNPLEPGKSRTKYVIWYAHRKGHDDWVGLFPEQIKKLHLYKNSKGQWVLSDRKPSPDDEPLP